MIRTGHGTGSNAVARVETPPIDELPKGLPAPTRKRGSGKPFDARTAREAGAKGGRAAKERRSALRALTGLGLHSPPPADLRPYLEDAEAFAAAECARLALEVGGGVCPPNATALVHNAALALAGSRFAYAKGDLSTGARLANDVRQHVLGAHELTAREAERRPKANGIAALNERLGVK